MSFSFIIIDLRNNLNIESIYNQLRHNYSNFELIYCSSKKVQNKNVVNYIFSADEKTENVVNTIIKYCTKTNIVMIRKFTSITDIKKQTDKLSSHNQIVYFTKKINKFKSILWEILNYFAKLLYHNSVLPINLSCITYGENASNVLKSLEYPSNLMRINKWEGINMIGVDGGEYYRPEYNLKKHVLMFSIPLVATIVSLICYFVFKQKITLLGKVIIWLISFICVILSMLFGVNWFINSKVGQGNQQKAKILKE